VLYFILKILSKLTLKSFFRRIRIVGKENIPENVPVIFIANHPSAFMDPIIVASTVKQPVYFIAAGEYVGKGVKGYMFRKWLHMIPVFRPSTRPEEVHKNKDMFNHCFDHLSSGRSLLIFPEGVSKTERKIKPFKTGVARIARGAELLNAKKLHLHIVPVGLNYSNPHQFRSDVFVNIGKAICVSDYISENPENEFTEVEQLTKLAEDRLHETVLHIDKEEDDPLLTKLHQIYSRDLKEELGIDFKEQEREFILQKNMLAAIDHFRTNAPHKFDFAVQEINLYTAKLNQYGITDKDIRELKFQRSFFRIASYILGLPFFLMGVVFNFIPYYLVQFILKRIRMNENFQGSMILAVGLILFFVFYVSVSIIAGILLPLGWWAVLLPAVMYITGIYSQMYLSAIQYTRQRKNLRNVFRQNKKMIQELGEERRKLIVLLEELRLEFEGERI